jgi:SAM-dependent methyltransferase
VDAREIERRRAELCSRFGEWTAHNISLKHGVYTFSREDPRFERQLTGHGQHLGRILQAVADVVDRPLSQLRVLDLACLEGLYGIEFARRGAEVVGIEGREATIERARFAKEVLGLDNLTLIQDDVRNLSPHQHGSFDVVLCLGILYHLDAADVFSFVEKMAAVCRRLAILDTHVAVQAVESVEHDGEEYSGWYYNEHSPESTPEQRLRSVWASLDNERSFWPTRPSLFNLLSRAGFTSVHTCQNPVVPGQWVDRDTLVAIKGHKQELLCTPGVKGGPGLCWSEEALVGLHPSQQKAVRAQEETAPVPGDSKDSSPSPGGFLQMLSSYWKSGRKPKGSKSRS